MRKPEQTSEPTEKEIEKLCQTMEYNALQLLIRLKECCQLSNSRAANLLNTGRSNITRHESGELGMTHRNYWKSISAYLLYLQCNNLKIPDELADVKVFFHFFVHKRF